jgi:hypothetical protein
LTHYKCKIAVYTVHATQRQKDTERIRNDTQRKTASAEYIICHIGTLKYKGF